jgi:hypothetical protein
MNKVFRDPHGCWWLIEGPGIRRTTPPIVPKPPILRRLLTRLRRAWAWLKGE